MSMPEPPAGAAGTSLLDRPRSDIGELDESIRLLLVDTTGGARVTLAETQTETVLGATLHFTITRAGTACEVRLPDDDGDPLLRCLPRTPVSVGDQVRLNLPMFPGRPR